MNRNKVVSDQWSVDSGKFRAAKPQAAGSIHHSSFIIHHSKGVSLLEVLISIFVLTVGLLGVLAIIPLGQMTVAESIRADRAGACGRAAMRDIKVQRLLDFRSWYWEPNIWGYGYDQNLNPPNFPIPEPDTTNASHPQGYLLNNQVNPVAETNGSFIIDPLGRTPRPNDSSYDLPSIFYGISGQPNTFLPRRTISPVFYNTGAARPLPRLMGARFYWPDDVSFEMNENTVDRPFINPTVGLDNMRSMDYSCLFTVSPSSSERMLPIPSRRMFDVTVAVFYQRNLNMTGGYPEGEWAANIVFPGYAPGVVVPGGGTIAVNTANNPCIYRVRGDATNGQQLLTILPANIPPLRENRWVMLWDSFDGRLAWYRVVGVALDATPPTLTLDGPDWAASATTKLIVLDGVIGTYKTTVELDYDALWGGM